MNILCCGIIKAGVMITYKASKEHQTQVTATIHKLSRKNQSPTPEELQVMKQYGKVVNS